LNTHLWYAIGMEDLFAGQWTLITGASSGLGEEFARQLAARRANLILTARSEAKLRSLARELSEKHAIKTEVVALDLGSPGGAEALCAAVDKLGHPVVHLVSNAGFGAYGALADSDGARQAEMVRLNCEALTVLSCHFVKQMLARGSGGIIHVASVAGFQPAPFMAVYAATKAYVLSFSEALAEELRGSGVRCTALCPGPVQTGFQTAAGAGIAASQRRSILSADETVARGLRGYQRNQSVLIPGAMNRMGAFGSWLMPRGLLVRTVGRIMRGKRIPAAATSG
jgi:short-subunit dehydrogenase